MSCSEKIYRVGYWLNAGYVIFVRANSDAEAIDSVERQLADMNDVVPKSQLVHFQSGIAEAEEVKRH